MKNLKLFLGEMPLREGEHAIYAPPFIAYIRVCLYTPTTKESTH